MTDLNFNKCKDSLKQANQNFTQTVKDKTQVQQNINDLLYRKSNWTSAEVQKFASLSEEELKVDAALRESKQKLTETERDLEVAQHQYIDAIRKHYTEEQVWTEQSRRISVYFSLSLFIANSALFLFSIFIFEPMKRQKILDGVETLIKTENLKLKSDIKKLSQNLQNKNEKLETHSFTQVETREEKKEIIEENDDVEKTKSSEPTEDIESDEGTILNIVKFYTLSSGLVLLFSLFK